MTPQSAVTVGNGLRVKNVREKYGVSKTSQTAGRIMSVATALRGPLNASRHGCRTAAFVVACCRYVSKMEMFQRRVAVEEIGRRFEVSGDQLRDVADRMARAVDAGLKCGQPPVRCWDTRVDYPPAVAATAPPVSRFLGLEVTDGRLVRARLTDVPADPNGGLPRSCGSDYRVADACSPGLSGRDLFDLAACCLAKFACRTGVHRDSLPLAFTFGFPLLHATPGVAVLQRWTKGVDGADTVGRDVVAELRVALRRSGLDVGPVAVFNDACVALLDTAADEPATSVGLVVDDGCNCCYAERAANVRGGGRTSSTAAGCTVVNTEWGAFGEDGALNCILNKYDRSLDARSQNPGQQTFEKLTSGKSRNTCSAGIPVAYLRGAGVLRFKPPSSTKKLIVFTTMFVSK